MQDLGMTVDATDLKEVEQTDDIKYAHVLCEEMASKMNVQLARIKHPLRIVIDVLPDEKMIRVGTAETKNDYSTDSLIPISKPKFKKILQICTPDGELWEDRYSYRTLLRFVENIGEAEIEKLKLNTIYGTFITQDEEKINAQVTRQKTCNGWKVITSISTADKVKMVNDISKLLNLDYIARITKIPVED